MRAFLSVSYLVLLCAFGVARAEEPATAPSTGPTVSPFADEVLRRVSELLVGSKTIGVEAEIWEDQEVESGLIVQTTRNVSVYVRKPDRLFATTHSTTRDRETFYNGKTLTISNRRELHYAQVEVPDNIDELADFMRARYDLNLPLIDFISADPYISLSEGLRAGTYLGRSEVLGVSCHHIAFEQETIQWQLWVEAGPQPLPRKLVIAYKDEPGTPQFTAIFTKWTLDMKIPDSTFEFIPSPRATGIELIPVEPATQPVEK